MSRGGRGGGGGQGIYEYDTALDDYMNARPEGEGDDDWLQALYPDVPLHAAPAPTAREKRMVAGWRDHRTAMRNGPFFVETSHTGKRDPSEFNAFEDANTYSNNKRPKLNGGLANLKKVPIVKELLPPELRDVVSDGEDDEDTERPDTKKSLDFLKKARIDRLARFDEGADETAAADKDDDDELNEDEEEDGVEELQDDDFSEDDDDLGNDYNAEKYFDDGDGADDEGEGGGDNEEAWAHEQKGLDRTVRDVFLKGLRREKEARGEDISSHNARMAAAGAELWKKMEKKMGGEEEEEEEEEEEGEVRPCRVERPRLTKRQTFRAFHY